MDWKLGVAGALLAIVLALGGTTCYQAKQIGKMKEAYSQAVARIKEANTNVEKCNHTIQAVLDRARDVSRDPAAAWNGMLDGLRTLPQTPAANRPSKGAGAVRRE